METDLSTCIKLHKKQTGNSDGNSDNKSKLMTFRDVLKQFMLKWHNFGHAPCLRKNKPSVLMEPPRCCCSFSSLGRWGESSMWGEGDAWYSCIISSPVNIPQSIAGELDVVLPLQPDNTLNSTHPSIIYPSIRPSAAPPGLHFTAPCTARWELQARSVARQHLHKLSLRNLSHGGLAPRAHAMEVKVPVKAPPGSAGRWDPVSY